jgi:signal peptidase II
MSDEPRGLAPVDPGPKPATLPESAPHGEAPAADPSAARATDPEAAALASRPVDAPPPATDTLVDAAPPAFDAPLPALVEPAPAPPAPLVASPPAAPPRRASYTFLVIVSVLSLAADLGTKAWAKARLAGVDLRAAKPPKVEVWKDHVDFIYALNPGGAWSFLRGLPELVRRPFFLFISAAAIVFIVSVYRRVRHDQHAMRWGLPLALGGAIGNLVDRIRYGSVIDFIDFYVKSGGQERHWPTYNVADVAIVVGVVLMAFDTLVTRHDHAPVAPAPSPPAPSDGPGLVVPGASAPGAGAPGQP